MRAGVLLAGVALVSGLAIWQGMGDAQGTASTEETPMEMLSALTVRPEHPSGYQRELFKHWTDQDGDGCDTRREVLLAEAVREPTVKPGCWITGGAWISVYDGQRRSGYPSDFDIDHLVPLAEVWRSGGYTWKAEQRQDYANDTTHPETLIAVTATTNRSKSDRGPEEWLPPRKQARCGYASDWVRVKYAWGLSVDRQEKRSLVSILKACSPKASLVL